MRALKAEDVVLRGGQRNQTEWHPEQDDTTDKLYGVSVYSRRDLGTMDWGTVNELKQANHVPNPIVICCRVRDIQRTGGSIRQKPVTNGPDHCVVDGLTAEQLHGLSWQEF